MGFKLILNDVDGVAAVVVATLVAGGQAAAAGVESGSRLLAVGGASVRTGAPDAYGVLGLKRDASAADVRRAYRSKTLECHPDRKGGGSAACVGRAGRSQRPRDGRASHVAAATRLRGLSTSSPRRRRDASPRNLHVFPAAPP